MSDIDAARAAIEGRMKAEWIAAGRTESVEYPEVDFEPPADGSRWVRITTLWGDGFEDQMDAGSGPGSTVVGVIQLDFYGAPGEGEGGIVRLADVGRGIFNMQDFGGVRCGPSSGPTGATPDREGWMQVSVTTPFEFDETVN